MARNSKRSIEMQETIQNEWGRKWKREREAMAVMRWMVQSNGMNLHNFPFHLSPFNLIFLFAFSCLPSWVDAFFSPQRSFLLRALNTRLQTYHTLCSLILFLFFIMRSYTSVVRSSRIQHTKHQCVRYSTLKSVLTSRWFDWFNDVVSIYKYIYGFDHAGECLLRLHTVCERATQIHCRRCVRVDTFLQWRNVTHESNRVRCLPCFPSDFVWMCGAVVHVHDQKGKYRHRIYTRKKNQNGWFWRERIKLQMKSLKIHERESLLKIFVWIFFVFWIETQTSSWIVLVN